MNDDAQPTERDPALFSFLLGDVGGPEVDDAETMSLTHLTSLSLQDVQQGFVKLGWRLATSA